MRNKHGPSRQATSCLVLSSTSSNCRLDVIADENETIHLQESKQGKVCSVVEPASRPVRWAVCAFSNIRVLVHARLTSSDLLLLVQVA